MHGLHLTADLRGCPAALPLMVDPDALRTACLAAVQGCGLTPVAELFHRFAAWPDSPTPPGITGMVLLAESHLAVHTWPELGQVTLDVYVCNQGADNSAAAHRLLAQLQAQFAPAQSRHGALVRGFPP